MQTILLLGGYGFIGTNILKYVDSQEDLRDKYSFIVFDRTVSHPHGVGSSCINKVYAGDFSDDTYIERIFSENNISIVLHCLSSTVPATSGNARFDVESNLLPTLKLLAVMDKYGVRDIVYLSSGGAIYGDALQKVHNEEDAVYPKSSYGVVKLAIEKYLLSYSELYGYKTLVLRLSNPFGKYHYNDRQGIVNVAIRKAIKHEVFEIWGNGDGVKDYIYVEDFCAILFALLMQGVESQVYNIGSGRSMSVNSIVDSVKKIIPEFEVSHIKASDLDVQSFELDITKLRQKIGKLPVRNFEDALMDTYKWQLNSIKE